MSESRCRTPQATKAGTLTAAASLAIPDKRRRVQVPASHRLFQPVDDFLSIFGILSTERPSDNNALDRLCHIEPGAPNRRVERHHPVIKEPAHQLRGEVSSQIIQHEKNA